MTPSGASSPVVGPGRNDNDQYEILEDQEGIDFQGTVLADHQLIRTPGQFGHPDHRNEGRHFEHINELVPDRRKDPFDRLG